MRTTYADFNAMTEAGHVRLTTRGSRDDIRDQGLQVDDWAWLSDGELTVGARIEDDPKEGLVGVPEWKTLVHLDDEEAANTPQLWMKLKHVLARHSDASIEEPAEVVRLLTIFEHVAPAEMMVVAQPARLASLRATALFSLGERGLAFHEAKAAIQTHPQDPNIGYLYLQVLLRFDLDRAAVESQTMGEKADASAPVLAACIDIWSLIAEQTSDDEFEPVGRLILDWSGRFDRAPGREQVQASILAGVQFNRGLALLRLGRFDQGRTFLELAHSIDPTQSAFDEATHLDAFDDQARRLAARRRESWPRVPVAA